MRVLTSGLLVGALLCAGVQAASAQQSSAPVFCQSGVGHPEHGRSWCVQKGFPLGSTSAWKTAQWDGVYLRIIRRADAVPRATLSDVLGLAVLDRLDLQRKRLNAAMPLSGRWLSSEGGGVVLQVYSGRTAVAELVDWNADGKVDLILVNSGLRQDEPRNTE